jgi:UDP-GlcNAc:undecaprenyl-phosphate GlcNAc-1-phosphate transferase
MKYLLAFTLSLIVSLIVTPVVIRLAKRLGVIDRPVDDRWHKKPTPRIGGVAIFAGFIVASAIFALALAGGCLGFLRYNFRNRLPARVFMGDCGSLFLGYLLSTLAILGFWQKTSPILLALTAPALILGYAVFDTILVTVLRLNAGGRPWIGGKDHSSHRLVKLGLSEKRAVLLLYALGIVGSLSAFIVLKESLAIGVPLAAFLCIGGVTFGFILAKAKV